MTPATFKYHSSPQDGEIRLLRVEPGSENEPVRCSLSIGKLQRGGYEALSYCWGTKPANRHILCDNQQFPVTENLLMALTRFRNTEQPRTLWIDAICINQTDLDEKSQQVAFMPSIYRKCTRVLVWLGEGDRRGRDTFSLIKETHHRISELGNWRVLLSVKLDAITILKVLQLPNPLHPRWVEDCRILELPYWRRMWILQEVLLGPQPVVHFGTQSMQLEHLEIVVLALTHFRIPGIVANGIGQLFMLREQGVPQTKYPLWQLLRDCRTSEASWPVDKIFALYGLTDSESDGGIGLRPDYETDHRTLFEKASAAMFHQSQDLSLLGMAADTLNPGPLLASWSPDWGVSEVALPLPQVEGDDMVSSPITRHFTSQPFRVNFREERGQKQLGILGVGIDVIPKVSDEWCPRTAQGWAGIRHAPRELRVFHHWDELAQHTHVEEYFLALRAGCEPHRRDEELERFQAWRRCQRAHRRVMSLQLHRIHPILHLIGCAIVTYALVLLGKLQLRHLERQNAGTRFMAYRRLCKTERGHLILATGRTRPSDRVVLAQGSHKPMIVRRKEGGQTDEMVFVGNGCMPALAQMAMLPDTAGEIWLA